MPSNGSIGQSDVGRLFRGELGCAGRRLGQFAHSVVVPRGLAMGTKCKSAAALAQLARVAATERAVRAWALDHYKGTEEHGPGRNLRETELRRDSRDAVGTRCMVSVWSRSA